MMKFLIIVFLIANICCAREKGDIERGDFNFDGKEDYRVFIMANGRKLEWNHFLFDAHTKEYVPSKKLDALWNPTFHSRDKIISTYANGGHAGSIYTVKTYVWDKDELKLMKLISQGWNREKELYHKITLVRRDGEMALHEVELLNGTEAFNQKNIEPVN